MTRSPWRSLEGVRRAIVDAKTQRLIDRRGEETMSYDSVAPVESRVAPGVRFEIARMSFGRRVELMRRVRELARKMEFLEAGSEPGERMDAALLQAEIDRLYLSWGLRS